MWVAHGFLLLKVKDNLLHGTMITCDLLFYGFMHVIVAVYHHHLIAAWMLSLFLYFLPFLSPTSSNEMCLHLLKNIVMIVNCMHA